MDSQKRETWSKWPMKVQFGGGSILDTIDLCQLGAKRQALIDAGEW